MRAGGKRKDMSAEGGIRQKREQGRGNKLRGGGARKNGETGKERGTEEVGNQSTENGEKRNGLVSVEGERQKAGGVK